MVLLLSHEMPTSSHLEMEPHHQYFLHVIFPQRLSFENPQTFLSYHLMP